MFKNYFKLAIRNLIFKRGSSRLLTIFNILGLAIGLSGFLLINGYVKYESNYDTYSSTLKDTYRITVQKFENGTEVMHSAKSYPGVGGFVKSEIPEVKAFTRILNEECLFHYKPQNVKFNRQKTYWADGSFPEVLGLEYIAKGDPSLLFDPNQTVISQSAAERFFGTDWTGDQNPIGKIIWLNEGHSFMIQGVYKDLPQNSHLAVDFIVSYATLVNLYGVGMDKGMPPEWNFIHTYISLKEGTSPSKIIASVNESLNSKIPESEKQNNVTFNFDLQPINDIHLTSALSDELGPNGNKTFVLALSISALFILVIAWINFINLATSKGVERAKEVGIRKAIGAEKKHLVAQFIFENMMASLLAALLATVIVWIASQLVSGIPGISNIFTTHGLSLWIIFSATVIFGGFISSVYPSLVISSYKAIDVLKGSILGNAGSNYFRKGLIMLQFFVAVFLLSCTGAIYYQIKFMRDQPLGIQMDQVLSVHTPRTLIGNDTRVQKFINFRDRLVQHATIQTATASGCLPGNEFLFHQQGVHLPGKEAGKNNSFDFASVDEGYLSTLSIDLVAGRDFSKDRPESENTLINEKAAEILGFKSPEDALNEKLIFGDKEKYIIGVVKDAHYLGLQKEITPLLLLYGHDYEFGYISLKMSTDKIQETISLIKDTWENTYPNDAFDSFFLDSHFARQYEQDEAFGQMFIAFCLLAIFIACFGLFSMALFITQQKTKEIAIRKVLGASLSGIVTKIVKGFLWPVLIAIVVAIPVSHYVITDWLTGFAFRFHINWWMYLLPVFVILSIAILTVAGHSVKAALNNPVDSLHDE